MFVFRRANSQGLGSPTPTISATNYYMLPGRPASPVTRQLRKPYLHYTNYYTIVTGIKPAPPPASYQEVCISRSSESESLDAKRLRPRRPRVGGAPPCTLR
eukprot:NODE_8453_length_356_cov_91.475570_g6701_i0.p1 GENE.NODE_8453_length_356_cov_91.475570_g6701_i0~~NODE_8453_length_356_cov_91.475570_g6701_i0.p1  ORF type:complete len:118 (+),score=33.86 NODE_8453_length_356_cov_91.475570_g6701_i0:52-354(+)